MSNFFGREGMPSMPDRERAAQKFRTLGDFAVTMEDHSAIGGTPYPEIPWVPGKAMHEVLTDAQIEEILDSRVEVSSSYTDPDMMEESYKELELDMRFLKRIGRLPPKYEDFLTQG